MGEAMERTATGPLDELKEATREYAQYAQDALGLGWLVGSGLLLGVVVLAVTSRAEGERWWPLARPLAIFAWLLTLRVARCGYQRLGAVTPPEVVATWSRRVNLLFVYLCAVASVGALVSAGPPQPVDPLPYAVGFYATAVLLPGLVALAGKTLHGRMDGLVVLLVAFPLSPVARWRGVNEGQLWALRGVFALFPACAALSLAWIGVQQHRAFLGLRRRLASFRVTAAAGAEEARP